MGDTTFGRGLGTDTMTDTRQPVDCVDPLIDTAKPKVRWVFTVFTARPFGMVRLGPNTDPVGTWGSGYRYNTDRIVNFSHIHAWQLSGVPVMPALRPPGGGDTGSRYRHETETAKPGYYDVLLDDLGIRVELTATDRVGFHRYTFPSDSDRFLTFDLGSELGPCEMSDAFVRRVTDTEIEGYVENEVTARRNKRTRIHFVARLSKRIQAFEGLVDGQPVGTRDGVGGKGCRAVIQCDGSGSSTVLLKIAISYVSTTQARLNLETELPGWDFDVIANESRGCWNRLLGRIGVEGGTRDRRTKFYTDVWRALVGGHIVSDVDGRYCDRTGPEAVVRRTPLDVAGEPKYPMVCGQDGFWHAQWSLSLLYSLAYPDLMSHYSNYLVEFGKNGGMIPRGPSEGQYTFVMLGASSTPWLVSAYMKGIRSFDVQAAYKGMRRNAFPGGLMSKAGYEFDSCEGGGIEFYIERGYIPDKRRVPGAIHVDGAAETLEYAYQDWCLAQLAKALGRVEDYALFIERSRNYRNLFDRESGFMRPRTSDGSWMTPFDPLSLLGWCEANSWQYTWHVPQDILDLVWLMGGPEAFVEKLDEGFRQAESMDFYAPKPDLKRDAATINYGNEPGRFVAHLFIHAGAPWLAQKWSRRVLDRTFSSVEPLGYCEDDDQGKAAATSALLALGLFDVRGGAAREPVYEITAPVFDRVTIDLDPQYYAGERFQILTDGDATNNEYIQSASLNGQPLLRSWFYHREFAEGGTVELKLGSEPNKSWGSSREDAPPSMTSDGE